MSDSLLERWKQNRKSARYLAGLALKLKRLRKKDLHLAQKTHEEVFSEMDCLSCANCCKSIPPMLSSRDIKRIAKRLNLSPKAFSENYTLVDEDGDTVMNASPCPFLQDDNKCEIYEDRPSACRLYPHSGEQLFIQNLSHHKRNMKYCPGLLEIVRRLASV